MARSRCVRKTPIFILGVFGLLAMLTTADAACFSYETSHDCAAREYRERQQRIEPRVSEQERERRAYERRQRDQRSR
jgi:hypothetical protein